MINIDWRLLLANIVTFLLAATVLWKIAWGPLTAILNQRKEKIAKDLESIEQTKRSVEKIESDYQSRVDNIQQQADQMIEQSRQEGARQREEIVRLAREEADKLSAKTRLQLEDEKLRLLRELRAEVTTLSIEMAEKLLRQSVNPEIRERFVKEAAQDMEGFIKR